jgi:transposase
MSEGEFFDRYPQCREFAEIFDWLRSLEISADVAAEVSRSLLWASGRAKRKGVDGGAVEAGKAGRPSLLSDQQIADLRAEMEGTQLSQSQFVKTMAARFGVSPETVRKAVVQNKGAK